MAARVLRRGREKEEEEGEVTVAVVEDKGYEHESGGEKEKCLRFHRDKGPNESKNAVLPLPDPYT